MGVVEEIGLREVVWGGDGLPQAGEREFGAGAERLGGLGALVHALGGGLQFGGAFGDLRFALGGFAVAALLLADFRFAPGDMRGEPCLALGRGGFEFAHLELFGERMRPRLGGLHLVDGAMLRLRAALAAAKPERLAGAQPAVGLQDAQRGRCRAAGEPLLGGLRRAGAFAGDDADCGVARLAPTVLALAGLGMVVAGDSTT